MDKNRIRELAGMKVLNETIVSWTNPGKGSNITLSTSQFTDAVIEAGFSSGKVVAASLTGKKDDKEQKKIMDKKLKAVIKLHQKFEKDVKKALEK